MIQPAPHPQLPLALTAPQRVDLELFVAGPNAELLVRLRQVVAGQESGCILVWGASGSGKSHLLQAACNAVSNRGGRSAYLPLQDLSATDAGIIEGLERFDLVAVDDVQQIAGQEDWERALFNLYNAVREQGGTLLFAASASPRGLPLQLADLSSRLGWGLVFRLQPLADADKLEALVRRAAARGLELPVDVADFLLRHQSRDLAGLMHLLEHLDTAQLATRRRLTIPFVKTLLAAPRDA